MGTGRNSRVLLGQGVVFEDGVCSQALEMLSEYGIIRAGGLVVACAADDTADDTADDMESKKTDFGSCALSRADAVTVHPHPPTYPLSLTHSLSPTHALALSRTQLHPLTLTYSPTYLHPLATSDRLRRLG